MESGGKCIHLGVVNHGSGAKSGGSPELGSLPFCHKSKSDGDGRSEESQDDGSQSSEERRPVRVFVAEENGTHITRLECESVTDPDESFDSDDSRYWRHHIVRYREIDAEEADEIQGQTETQTHVDTTVTTRAGRVVQPKTWGEDFELTHRGKR